MRDLDFCGNSSIDIRAKFASISDKEAIRGNDLYFIRLTIDLFHSFDFSKCNRVVVI